MPTHTKARAVRAKNRPPKNAQKKTNQGTGFYKKKQKLKTSH
jgi:hypothetical protein